MDERIGRSTAAPLLAAARPSPRHQTNRDPTEQRSKRKQHPETSPPPVLPLPLPRLAAQENQSKKPQKNPAPRGQITETARRIAVRQRRGSQQRQAGVGADGGAPRLSPPRPHPRLKNLDPAHCSLCFVLCVRARLPTRRQPGRPIRLPGPVSAPESFPSSRSAAAPPPPPGSRGCSVSGAD
ncbi:hypothetical protein GQ55_5G186300 [Panicum hallii var. hallii]|uniref:Uncharacterized protein n=1 Tax=Panicum hallii var. hallii TaxID=1504633 RepID=A0A2T7DHP9_9POAL|nr:hypothetical protein GQ55_5G186300 [Panicum hallii var. hallii]